ncbi:hypothetical protein BGZ82_008153 [Podila clonocystis]|nr:hypothetical protein BGZ82_008153 [Podila clonocystis]
MLPRKHRKTARILYNLQNRSLSTVNMSTFGEAATFAAAARIPGREDIIPMLVATALLQLQNVGNIFKGTPQSSPGLRDSPLYAIPPSNSEQAVFVLAAHFDTISKSSSSALFRLEYGLTTWTQVATTGEALSPRQGACMVPARNGMQLVDYGGFTATILTSVADIPVENNFAAMSVQRLETLFSSGVVLSQGLVQYQILDLDLDHQDQKLAQLRERSVQSLSMNAQLDFQNLPPYTDLPLRSPEAISRQPQEDEVQARQLVLDEYRRQRAIQLEKQQELDRQIERELVEVQC